MESMTPGLVGARMVASRHGRRPHRASSILIAACLAVVGIGLAALPLLRTVKVRGEGKSIVVLAARETLTAGSSRVALTIKGSNPKGAKFTVKGDGLVDLAAKTGTLVFDVSSLFPGASSFEERFFGSTVYMNAGSLPTGLALDPGTHWMKFDLAKLYAGRVDVSKLSMEQSPMSSLEQLVAVSDDVAVVGTETVRDAVTTHYAGELDFAKVAASKGLTGSAAAALVSLPSAPVSIWVDDVGRVRKFEISFSQPDQSKSFSMSVEFYDFGVPVNVDVPPDADTTDAGSLPGAGQQLNVN